MGCRVRRSNNTIKCWELPTNIANVVLSKMCEHIVHCAISNHFDTHNVHSDPQHGFRNRRSCETQLILTVDDLAKVLDDKSQMDAILLDFSMAFNKVPHKRLLLKVASHGIHWPGSRMDQRLFVRSHSASCSRRSIESRPASCLWCYAGQRTWSLVISNLYQQPTGLCLLIYCTLVCRWHSTVQADFLASWHSQSAKWPSRASVIEKKWMMEFNPSKC